MNRFILVCFLFCGASGYSDVSGSLSNASRSMSGGVHTVKEVIDIKKELNDLRTIRRSGKKRARRYSESSANSDATAVLNKVSAGIYAFLKTYLYQPIAHGNFQESTIRGYRMLSIKEGQFVFGTLNGDLNQSFRSIMRDRRPRTGDIISCRIPTDRMAEHYMMVINSKHLMIAEVGVLGGKSTHNGMILIDSYRKSSYINSTECLYHENRLVSRAEQIDDKNGDDSKADQINEEIFLRLNCTVKGENSAHFYYSVWSCNCQDLVLYWAYGYVETNCLSAFFNNCSGYLTNGLFKISGFVDEDGHLQREAKEYSDALEEYAWNYNVGSGVFILPNLGTSPRAAAVAAVAAAPHTS